MANTTSTAPGTSDAVKPGRTPRGRGRRPGNPDTRDAILAAGRQCFMKFGYRGATVRQIAERASVDSRLIGYHFGSKRGLFAEAMALPLSPSEVLSKALSGPPHTWSIGILSGMLTAWESPESGLPLRRLLTAAFNDHEQRRALTEFIERELCDALTDRLEAAKTPYARSRATAAVTVITGAILSRYILGVEPISSMSRERVITVLRPLLDAALHPRPQRATPTAAAR